MEEQAKNKDTAILICSYDGAKDLWKPLQQTYMKYWKDCPYNIYLSTNNESPSLKNFTPLRIGKEDSWSDNILKCLKKIDEKYVLLTFDDLFLCSKINTNKVVSFIDLAVENNWDYLRLHPSPLPDEYVSTEIGKIAFKRLYRSSTVWALFNKKILIDLLDKRETAWEFERNGSKRSDKYEHFYCSKVTVIPYINGVVKGKWIPKALDHLINDGIEINKNTRDRMTSLEFHIEKYKRFRLKIFFKLVPSFLRYKIKNYF